MSSLYASEWNQKSTFKNGISKVHSRFHCYALLPQSVYAFKFWWLDSELVEEAFGDLDQREKSQFAWISSLLCRTSNRIFSSIWSPILTNLIALESCIKEEFYDKISGMNLFSFSMYGSKRAPHFFTSAILALFAKWGDFTFAFFWTRYLSYSTYAWNWYHSKEETLSFPIVCDLCCINCHDDIKNHV